MNPNICSPDYCGLVSNLVCDKTMASKCECKEPFIWNESTETCDCNAPYYILVGNTCGKNNNNNIKKNL